MLFHGSCHSLFAMGCCRKVLGASLAKGALLYAVSRHRGRGAGWVPGGVAGTVFPALGWIPVNPDHDRRGLPLFGVTNVGARLVLTRWRRNDNPGPDRRGRRPPPEVPGRTAMSVGVDGLVGGRFRRDSAPTAPSPFVGGMLG